MSIKNQTPLEIPTHLSKEEVEIYLSVVEGLHNFKLFLLGLETPEGWDPKTGPTMPQLHDMKLKLEGKVNPSAELEKTKAENLPLDEEDWETVFLKIKNSKRAKD